MCYPAAVAYVRFLSVNRSVEILVNIRPEYFFAIFKLEKMLPLFSQRIHSTLTQRFRLVFTSETLARHQNNLLTNAHLQEIV